MSPHSPYSIIYSDLPAVNYRCPYGLVAFARVNWQPPEIFPSRMHTVPLCIPYRLVQTIICRARSKHIGLPDQIDWLGPTSQVHEEMVGFPVVSRVKNRKNTSFGLKRHRRVLELVIHG